MLRLTCATKMVITLALVARLSLPVVLAETISSYSGRYTADLEQKQALLESIQEDACETEAGFKNSIDRDRAFLKGRAGRLGVENIELARVMPPMEKINMASAGMSCTLSPLSESEGLIQERNRARK